jgi:hypothetical protein
VERDCGVVTGVLARLRGLARDGSLGRAAYEARRDTLVEVVKRAALSARDERVGVHLFNAVWGRQLRDEGGPGKRQRCEDDFAAAAAGCPGRAVSLLQHVIASAEPSPRPAAVASALHAMLERAASPT